MNKQLGAILAVTVLLVSSSAPLTRAAAEITITGKAMCAKCMLHQGSECQTVIQSKEDGKTVTYYLADNDVAKKFHDNVCTSSAKVKATGTVKEVDGKMQLTATSIEKVKN